MAAPIINGHHNGINGHSDNGNLSINGTSVNRQSIKSQASRETFKTEEQITILRQTIVVTRRKFIDDITDVTAVHIDEMSAETFLKYLDDQRLIHCPEAGSKWDRVLHWAEFFAFQVSRYDEVVSAFLPGSESAAKLIWSACRVLVELGETNAQAIETAFEVFYNAGRSLSFFLQQKAGLSLTSHIRTQFGEVFNDLLILVRDVALHYWIQTNTLTNFKIHQDFNKVFHRQISAFYNDRDHVIDVMWVATAGKDASQIKTIRQWLNNNESIVRTIIRDKAATRSRRQEFTCQWFQTTLLGFSRGHDRILAVTGGPSTGKSYLASWIVDRLQRPLGRKSYDTLSAFAEAELPNQSSELGIAKSILFQLLHRCIGDVSLLKALWHVHNLSLGPDSNETLENELWGAIDVGLKSLKTTHIIIVVNGLDDRCTHENAVAVSKRLGNLSETHSHVKIVVLARNAEHLPKAGTQVHAITSGETHHDLELIAQHTLGKSQYFHAQPAKIKDEIIHKILDIAQGNFLSVRLLTKSLKQQSSLDNFNKIYKSFKESITSEQLIRQVIAHVEDPSRADGKLILTWLLAAKRPLASEEIHELLQVHKKVLGSSKVLDTKTVKNLCGQAVTVQSGIVRFSHTAIQNQMVKLSNEGEKFPKLPVSQTLFVTILLAYIKSRLTASIEPTYDVPEDSHFLGFLGQDSLLKYAATNWLGHFKRSSLHKVKGPIELPADFKANFPSSVQLVFLEWVLWKAHYSASEVFVMHQLSLNIRRYTSSDESALQTLILCGHALKVQSRISEAAAYFFEASRLCQSLYDSYRAITVSCITTFLEQTSSVVSTTRTEIITQREELLVNIVNIYKQRWGKTSELVVKHLRILAELYESIHENQHSEKIWIELREIMVTLHGKGSSEERNICGHLDIVLTKGKRGEDVSEYEIDVFSEVSHLPIWHVDRIAILLEQAWKFEARGDLLQAEVYFLMLWNGVIEHCHSDYVGIEIHISALNIALEYVRFLRKHHRHEEAAGILICVWAEYERHQFESEALFIQLVLIGKIMLEINLHSNALSVFKRCWSWFHSREMHVHVSSCQILIIETIEEISKSSLMGQRTTSTSTSTTISTTTTTTEIIMKEVFESSLSSKTVTTETLSISRSLISFYMKAHQWSKAIEVTKKTLVLLWRSIVIGGGICALPRDFGFEAIEIAISLATCHNRVEHYHEAEVVYLRIFRACFNSCQISDKRFTKIYEALISFYEAHGHWQKVIGIHREVLAVSRKRLGGSHSTTITILYDLGRICHDHGYADAHLYYEEIISVLNTGSVVCHHNSLDAMEFLCRFYFEEGHWESLRNVCKVLWEVWTTRHREYALDSEFVALLYMRFIYVLEHHSHCEFEITRKISLEYWKTCCSVFGAFAAVTLKSLITLAEVCIRKEEYRHEAIEYYEEVIKASKTSTTTTTISTETITQITERLTSVYIQVCSSSTVSTTIIERAINVLTERFEHTRKTYGCASSQSLTILREIVQMHFKLKKEALVIVEKLLFESVLEIITKVKHSSVLYEAAKLLAQIFIDFDLREQGRARLLHIHTQVMANTCGFAHNGDLKLDASIGRSSYVFLVVFEELVAGLSTSSYTKIMADFLTETVLWQSYSTVMKSEKNIELLLTAGARLCVFLEKKGRKEQLAVIQTELHKRFVAKWGSHLAKVKAETSLFFLITVLDVLGSDAYHTQLGTAACIASHKKINDLLVMGEYKSAYDLAVCVSQFLHCYGAYQNRQNMGHLFKLSSIIALRELKTQPTMEPALHEAFLKLSREVIDEVLKAGKKSNINFVRLKHDELNDLISLLGFQENYTELKWLLENLWNSRENQKKSTNEIITIGTLLAQVHHLLGNTQTAITLLSNRISYNVALVYSPLHPQSLLVSELLSQLYTEAKLYKEAMRVHEEILRLIVEGDDDDDETIDEVDAVRVRRHLDWLKAAFVRNGGWDVDGERGVYEDVVGRSLEMGAFRGHEAFKGAVRAEKWGIKEKVGGVGRFEGAKWEFLVEGEGDHNHHNNNTNGGGNGASNGVQSPGLYVPKRLTMNGLRKVSSHWGFKETRPELVI